VADDLTRTSHGEEGSPGPPPSGVPSQIGRYRILRVIGEGGMGTVYEAEQENPRRTVALKVVRAGFVNEHLLRRFEQESNLLGRLQHPGIAQVHEAGTANSGSGPQPYFAMELVRGRTLRAELRRHGACPPAVAAEWFEQVFAGVAAAHAQGIVHRDLKPENAIIASGPDGRDRIKVLDFGLAKLVAAGNEETRGLTQAGAVIGTPGYMAPEQMTGGAIDERTDIFALGVMVAEAVTGTRPFDGQTTNEILAAVGMQPIQFKGDGPHWRELERVLQLAVARSPGDRYRHINDLVGSVLPALRAFPPMASNSEEPTRMA